MQLRIFLTACLFFLNSGISSAGNKLWELILSDGTVISDIKILELSGDSLLLFEENKIISIESINTIKLMRTSNPPGAFWEGAKSSFIAGGIGMAAAAIIGIIINTPEGGIPVYGLIPVIAGFAAALGIVGGTAGAVTEAAAGGMEIFDIAGLPLKEKKEIITKILSPYKDV